VVAGSNRAYYGYITHGGKFGVSIGQAAADAQVVLREREKFEYRGSADCSQLGRLIECRKGQKYDIYGSGASVRNGVPVSTGFLRLEVGATGDIKAIIWRFYLLPSLDL